MVYQAYDPRLRRNIAIKVSAAQFTEGFECRPFCRRPEAFV